MDTVVVDDVEDIGSSSPKYQSGGTGSEVDSSHIREPAPTLDAELIVAAQEKVFVDTYKKVVPSIVQISTSRKIDDPFQSMPFDFDGPTDDRFQHNGGSGFVWDEFGHIVTNHHVVVGVDRVTVMFHDGGEYDAELLGSDPDSDLAVLAVNYDGDVPSAIAIGNSGDVAVGQIAIAIGSPFGQDFSITSGIVSAVGRTIKSGNSPFSIPKVLQTDAPINPGNSGGPLLNRLGEVIGVNTQIISNTGASSGIGFAVPVDAAKRVIPELIANGRYDYSWLGISGTSLTPDILKLMGLEEKRNGALVVEIIPDGPAEQGGLLPSDTVVTVEGLDYRLGGDIIVGVDGTSIADMDQLISYLIENTKAGDSVDIEVIRDGSHQTVTVVLGERP
tara:strand:- start:976 stop:2139 length:1164 start_codon:yes stop_codon:yes gene_type:complete